MEKGVAFVHFKLCITKDALLPIKISNLNLRPYSYSLI